MSKQQQIQQDASWGELLSGKNGLRTLALTGGVALHAINIYIVTTILPSIVQDIGGMQYYAWNTTLFIISSIIGSALAAQILAQLTPRSAYLLGLMIFALGSIWCGLASNMPLLLVGRVLQGLGGGILLALSYALIRIVFEQRLWSRAMGITSGMWGVATLVGRAVGGLFAQYGQMSNKALGVSPKLYSVGVGFNFFLPVGLMSFQISNGNEIGNPFKFNEIKIHWGILSRF